MQRGPKTPSRNSSSMIRKRSFCRTKGSVKSDQGTLDFDKVQLGYCHITSPYHGRVGLRLVDPGNLVQSSGSTALVVVTQIEPITVIFTLAQDHLDEVLAQLRTGAKLTVDAYDRNQQTKLATGKLTGARQPDRHYHRHSKAARRIRQQERGPFSEPVRKYSPAGDHPARYDADSRSAIQHNGEVAFVYVIQNGTAHVHNVKAGTTDAGVTAVEGINPGDEVATSSFEKLQDGSKVIISKKPLPQDTSESNAP